MAKNRAPKIISDGGKSQAAKILPENTSVVTTVVAKDADRDRLTYSISGTDATLFNINASNGIITFKTLPNFEAPGDNGANNVYNIVAQASDGKAVATQAFVIGIRNVNDAPVIDSNGGGYSATVTVLEGTTAVTTVHARDEDNAALTYSITGGADAAIFTVDRASGALRFVSTPNFEQPADRDGNNVYNVTVAATDGRVKDTQALAVSVTDVPETPSSGNNIVGTDESETFDISAVGNFTVSALAGNDLIDAGAAFTAADSVDGGAHTDTLRLKGDYSAGLLIGTENLRNVELIETVEGFSYSLTFKAGVAPTKGALTIDGSLLGPGESLRVDTTAETNAGARYSVIGGSGDDILAGGAGIEFIEMYAGNDTLHGGAGDDRFSVEARFLGAGDHIDGGTGDNRMSLYGGSGDGAAFSATTLKNVNSVSLSGAADWALTAGDDHLEPGQVREIDGSGLLGTDTLVWNASAESDPTASYRVLGGPGNDMLIGGAGDDWFRTGAGLDQLTGNGGRDTFSVAFNGTQANVTDFTTGPAGDVLGIASLIEGYTPDAAAEFIRQTEAGGNTTVSVDRDGSAGGFQFQEVVHLVGVSGVSLESMLANGNIDVTR